MVRILARDTIVGPVLFRRQLPPQMLLIDHLLRTSLFPLQHYVQRRGAILEALYRISEGFWFSPSELVMTSLLHFEDKVHRKGLARAESIPLLMPRLLSQVLEHLGFPEEPRIERRIRCPQVLTMERAMVMSISFLLQQQDHEEAADEEAEMARSPVPDLSPPSPPPPASATARPMIYSTALSGVRSCQYQGASRCYGCCLFISLYTGIDGPEVDSSRDYSRALSYHAPADHESPRSPACSCPSR